MEKYPSPKNSLINIKLEEKMKQVREVVALALAERSKKGIKVRQPLLKLEIKGERLEDDLVELIKEEVNIKDVKFSRSLKKKIKLDTVITPELKEEGIAREFIRNIQDMRKKAKLKAKDKILVVFFGSSGLNGVIMKNREYVLNEVNIRGLVLKERSEGAFIAERETKVDRQKVWIAIKKT